MRCPACDSPNPPEAVRCEECGKKLPPQPRKAAAKEDAEGEEPRSSRVKRADSAAAPPPRRRKPEDIDEEEDEDEDDEPRPRRRRVRREGGDDAMSTLIPYKNPKALASYYLGIFSLVPVLGIFLSPVALVLGILGVRYRNANPEAKGTAHAIVGIILGGLSLLCHVGIGVLAVAFRNVK